jgi:hypothetical protein
VKVVLVTGSRETSLDDSHQICSALADASPEVVVQGGATGADGVALNWCRFQFRSGERIQCWTVPADWKRHGKRAGPIRNEALVDIAVALKKAGNDVLVLAFPGPSSIGTHHCIKRATYAGLTVEVHAIGGAT